MKYKISFDPSDTAICDTKIIKDGVTQTQIKDYYFKNEIKLYNGGHVDTFYMPNASSIFFTGLLALALTYIIIDKVIWLYNIKKINKRIKKAG